jgi:hypothetical protein
MLASNPPRNSQPETHRFDGQCPLRHSHMAFLFAAGARVILALSFCC